MRNDKVLRLTVTRWDAGTLYGRPMEGGKEVAVALRIGEDENWTYLTEMIEKGSRVNVVNGTAQELPQLLVLEPDYLVDISTIAGCFERYAESPQVLLLGRLRPRTTSEAVVLGHLASQLLDEEVHASAGGAAVPRYEESVRSFFLHHAVSLLTAGVGEGFHEQGRKQQRNIRHAVREELPLMAKYYDAREAVLEPSFFSEMLGLQGRMDLMQLDGNLVIEQKSGKGSFPEPDPSTPVPQFRHYVQLLLYMALLRYGCAGSDRLQAFLLYSKYEHALQQVGFSKPVLLRAMKVRNGIAAAERTYVRGGMSTLLTMTPEALNELGLTGTLWQQFVRPQMEALLAPLHEASQLERAYWLRLQTFVATEHMREKVGVGTKENAGFAAKWIQSVEEKLSAGELCRNLEIKIINESEEGRVERVRLEKGKWGKDDDAFTVSNFRQSDIVIFYPYQPDTEPDMRERMVFRGTIAALDGEHMEVSLRAAQTDAHVFLRSAALPWAVEHDFMESTFAPLYRGLHAFLSAPRERRDLVLLQRMPSVDERRQLRLDHGAFNELALRVRQAEDLFLIVGPPGTGKTSFGLMTTLREELADPQGSVLLLSYTNRAVDEICSKLVAADIAFLRVGSQLACPEEYRPQLLEEQVATCGTLGRLRQTLQAARVVVGTTTALSAQSALLELHPFSLAIVDEASQILEPHLMTLLAAQVKGRAAIRKFVFIGDHKQLPAVVQQSAEEARVDDSDLRAIGLTDCRLSLFERFLNRYGHHPRITYQLTRQGRMHRAIAAFPNEAFYGGTLREVPLPHQTATLQEGDRPRVQFIDVQPIPFTADELRGTKTNLAEAQVIARCVQECCQRLGKRLTPESIGIIVPYRHQIAAIRNAIEASPTAEGLQGANLQELITIDTVERFQGSQRDVIIYGFTVQQPAQLDFLTELCFEENGHVIDRKLNVALTRAREHLILVGNAALLRQNDVYARLIEKIRN